MTEGELWVYPPLSMNLSRVCALLPLMLLPACALDTADADGQLAPAVEVTPTITFGADFSQRVTGTITAGAALRIAYDPARLPDCRGTTNNLPAWSLGGSYRVNGGAAQTFTVAPQPAGSQGPVSVTLPATAGTVEFWFEVGNRWGCHAWDSNYGHNYAFTVAPDPRAPGWVGNGASVISRETCSNGGPCDRDRRDLATRWTYETWARQRAALRAVYFEVWKSGVTDRDNPDLWRQLDVRMYSRFGSTGPFAQRYVTFDQRVGNNARYAVDLRAVDPLPDFPALTTCPAAPLSPSPDGQLVQTLFEYYFTVNGVEYRPAGGGVFSGVFANYRTALLATCLPR